MKISNKQIKEIIILYSNCDFQNRTFPFEIIYTIQKNMNELLSKFLEIVQKEKEIQDEEKKKIFLEKEEDITIIPIDYNVIKAYSFTFSEVGAISFMIKEG